MTIRCKLRLTEITQCEYSPTVRRLKFTTQYDPAIPEDQRFYKATPSGEFTMLVDNPVALEAFVLGKCYYFDAVACSES